MCNLFRASGYKVPETNGCVNWDQKKCKALLDQERDYLASKGQNMQPKELDPNRCRKSDFLVNTMHSKLEWPSLDFDIIFNEHILPESQLPKVLKYANNNKKIHIKYLTMLRHPYDRSLSHYKHLRTNKPNLELENFLTQGSYNNFKKEGFASFICNQQTLWLANQPIKNYTMNEHIYRNAIENLNKMQVVLILDNLSDPNSCSQIQLEKVFGINYDNYLAQKLADHNVQASNFSSFFSNLGYEESRKIYSLMHDANTYDMKLYKFAYKRCQYLAQFHSGTLHFENKLQKDKYLTISTDHHWQYQRFLLIASSLILLIVYLLNMIRVRSG